MTNLQEVEFNILKEFDRACDKLDISYYLVCGSALGAAKYDGFIPWDDDLDIGMLRSDYERFLREGQELLPSYIFLQNYRTDKYYPLIYSKLRDNRTTFIEKGLSNLDINHGVYIDVFPIDGYPKTKKEKDFLEKKKKFWKFQILCAVKTNSNMKLVTRFLLQIERIIGCHKRTNKTIEKLTDLLAKYSTEESDTWCNHGNWQGKLEYASREQYGKGTWATFEGLNVRIPEKYDEYLTQKYGDWRADLPEEQKFGHHYAKAIDLKRPYTDYIEKLANGEIRLKTLEEI